MLTVFQQKEVIMATDELFSTAVPAPGHSMNLAHQQPDPAPRPDDAPAPGDPNPDKPDQPDRPISEPADPIPPRPIHA